MLWIHSFIVSSNTVQLHFNYSTYSHESGNIASWFKVVWIVEFWVLYTIREYLKSTNYILMDNQVTHTKYIHVTCRLSCLKIWIFYYKPHRERSSYILSTNWWIMCMFLRVRNSFHFVYTLIIVIFIHFVQCFWWMALLQFWITFYFLLMIPLHWRES